MNEEDIKILEQELAEWFPYSGSDIWHEGEWKQAGTVLFKKRVVKGYNLVLRLVRNRGMVFVEEYGVTRGLRNLGFDKYILEK